MNNLTAEESRLGDCLFCFGKIENYNLLPDQEYQKIVENCWKYLHKNIANSKLQNIKSENENEPPLLCKKCFDAASKLMELSELLKKSQKKILNLRFEFAMRVLHGRTQLERLNNIPDGQNSPKDHIVLDVSRVSPSLVSMDQLNPTETDYFAQLCENNFIGMDATVNDAEDVSEIVKHDSKEAAYDDSAESEDDANMTIDEELPAPTCTRPVVVLKKLKEVKVYEKSSRRQSPRNASRLKQGLRNGTSNTSTIIHGKIGGRIVKKGKKSISSLKVRGRVETGKMEHKCQECEKVCAKSSDLKKHIREHTGERPFKCSFCCKAFAHSSNLLRHERIHTRETNETI